MHNKKQKELKNLRLEDVIEQDLRIVSDEKAYKPSGSSCSCGTHCGGNCGGGNCGHCSKCGK